MPVQNVMKQNVLFTPQTFFQKFLTNSLIINNFVQANSGTRQPLPELDLREAPGAGDPAVHGEARDAPRPRLQREPVRLLQGQGRPASYTQGREREAKTK